MEWTVSRCWLGIESMQVLYGICDDSELRERTLDHLEGYRGSALVRISNAALHGQLDVFGEVALSLATDHKHHGNLSDTAWVLLRQMADLACQTWHLPDHAPPRCRGPERHFVCSKIMCWVALECAARLAEDHGEEGPVERWRAEAEKLHADILAHGWSEEKGSFVQAYGSDTIDASALLIPFVGSCRRTTRGSAPPLSVST